MGGIYLVRVSGKLLHTEAQRFAESPITTPPAMITKTLRITSFAALAAALLLLVTPAPAAMVVVPGNLATTEGNTSNSFPFSLPVAVGSMRYQQVYGSTAFGALGGPALITQIAFRPDAVGGAAFSSTLSNIQFNLSTTAAAPDALSGTFANNVGADDTTVFSGAWSLSSAFTGPAGGPKDFDIVLTLTTPFLYDPSLGNLLLDIRNFAGGTTTFFDTTNVVGDAVSRAFTLTGGVNAPTTDIGSGPSFGLVTQFTFDPVAAPPLGSTPEPTTALFGAALLAACGLSRRRTRLI